MSFRLTTSRPALCCLVLLALVGGPARADAPEKISFARDIRPILSDKCFFCHGPDDSHRKARLRLDTRAGAVDEGEVITPGKAGESELYRRLTTDDASARMPPEKSGKSLTRDEVELIRQWIEQGAEYEGHWAFTPPKRPALPAVKDQAWVRNPIDAFVLARLEREGLSPSPEADRRTLLRRVSLDLTGLPPTPEELAAFLADGAPDAYGRVVDRLLSSPHYGERMAMVWLDAARYSDTDGFQLDETRTNWPWRDWVVSAYNRNMPFDRFTTWQFAGDLLPGGEPEQVLATCFHRNHMTNGEGGRDPEESRVDYVVDRVNTTGTVWLGLTLGCCQCHNHRFDPVSQRDYYRLAAFFNSIDEDGRAGRAAKPYLKYRPPSVEDGLAESRDWLARKRAEYDAAVREAEGPFRAWLADRARGITAAGRHSSWSDFPAASLKTTGGTSLAQRDGEFVAAGPNPRHDDYVLSGRPALPRVTGLRLRVLPLHGDKGLSLDPGGHATLTNLKVGVRTGGQGQLREVGVAAAAADYQAEEKTARGYGPVRGVLDDDPRTGWSTEGSDPREPRTAVFAFAEPVALGPDDELVVELRHRSLHGYCSIRRFRLEVTAERGPLLRAVGPAPLEKLADVGGDAAKLADADLDRLREQFLEDHAPVVHARAALDRAKEQHREYQNAATVNVMVLKERPEKRPTHVLLRGVWDSPGERVEPGTPAAVAPWPAAAPADRLGLAQWLVSGDNPLTARVAVNRYWQMYFGEGLVRTPEDFGAQGEMPTHPGLLDWLAVEFLDSGWDVRHIQKLIVTSATYRQSSAATPEFVERDPGNRLLARASRFRLPSWMIRDSALRVSGLLHARLGGPPVYPYQPDGVWEESTMGRFRYRHSVGPDLYRRSLYTFWRRSVAPTALFDAAQRRVCEVRPARTNTPLHALTLMNDTTFVEAARVLAQGVMGSASGANRTKTISNIFERVLCRPPSARERAALARQFDRARGHYAANPADADALLAHGQAPVPDDLGRADLAAYTAVAMTVLNLDEAITRE